MEIIKENTTRKVDSLGRISIPKGMRDRYEIKTGAELEFVTMRDADGVYYVAMVVARPPEPPVWVK